MHVYVKIVTLISLISLLGLTYTNVNALSIYFLGFTVTDHETNIVRSFNLVLYDHNNDHSVTSDIPIDLLDAIELGCGKTTLSFPSSYTCKSQKKTVELHSSSAFIVSFLEEGSSANASVKDFKFSAENMCNEDISKNGLCLDISGKGTIKDNRITGSGIYKTHTIKQVDRNRSETLSNGLWSTTMIHTTSDIELSFKARTSTKIVYLQMIEGDSEHSGLVCAYGSLVAIQKAEDSICVDDAFVVIGTNSNDITGMEGERPTSPIEVTTEKTDYYDGEVVNIEGRVPALTNGHEVNIIVKDADGKTFTKIKSKPTYDNTFATSFTIPSYSKLFPVGKWSISVSYAIWVTKVDFNVLREKVPMNSVTVSEPEISGTASNIDIKVGDKVTITSEIKNEEQRELSVYYIVQVEDNSNATVMLDWFSRIIGKNETVELFASWTPELEGEYTVQTFVWNDIVNPIPLSTVRDAQLIVLK